MTELHDRRGRRSVGDHQRRRGPRRQRAHRGLHDSGHLCQCRLDVGVGLKENFDDADAVYRLRLDVLDVIDRNGHAAFGVGDDAVGHVAGREAGKVPHHADHGNIDVGENVNRRAQNSQGHQQNNDQRHDHKRIRAPQR